MDSQMARDQMWDGCLHILSSSADGHTMSALICNLEVAPTLPVWVAQESGVKVRRTLDGDMPMEEVLRRTSLGTTPDSSESRNSSPKCTNLALTKPTCSL